MSRFSFIGTKTRINISADYMLFEAINSIRFTDYGLNLTENGPKPTEYGLGATVNYIKM